MQNNKKFKQATARNRLAVATQPKGCLKAQTASARMRRKGAGWRLSLLEKMVL